VQSVAVSGQGREHGGATTPLQYTTTCTAGFDPFLLRLSQVIQGSSTVLVMLLMTPAAHAGDKGQRLNPKVLGKTYGEWSAQWWKWAVAGPAGANAVGDLTGADCAANQPNGSVWFLTGSFGVPNVERDCTIPPDKSLFYPLANGVWIDCPPPSGDADLTDEDVRNIMAAFGGGGDTACQLTSSIDGEEGIFGTTTNSISSLQILDVRTQSPVFSMSLPDGHVFSGVFPEGLCDPELPAGETGRSISEGHWVMVPPLSPGEHVLKLHGSGCDPADGSPFFEVGVTYYFTVLDDD
jgi:hypothetical protein